MISAFYSVAGLTTQRDARCNTLAVRSTSEMAVTTTETNEKKEKENVGNRVAGAFVDYFYKGEVPS